MKTYLCFFLIVLFYFGCYNNDINPYPKKIGENNLSSVVTGDSAVKEINTLHHLSVAAENNIIICYGEKSEDVLYISKFKDNSAATESFKTMVSKMRTNKNSPFTYLVPMKKYDNKSFMTLGLGSVHYIYQSEEYLLWLSTKQKFHNELPQELLKIYPVN